MPPKTWVRDDSDDLLVRLIAMPAMVRGSDGKSVAGVKWIGSSTSNAARGLPRASAMYILNDASTMRPVAVMEGATISAMRTVATTVVAADALAPNDVRSLAVVGCGLIGRLHLAALSAPWPGVADVRVFDLDEGAAHAAAESIATTSVGPATIASSATECLVGADAVVFTTSTTAPYLGIADLASARFVACVVLRDLDAAAVAAFDAVIVDDWDHCYAGHTGIRWAVDAGLLSRSDLRAQLGDVLSGAAPGRLDDRERIGVFPVGLGVVDLVCAAAIHQQAVQRSVGLWVPWDGPE